MKLLIWEIAKLVSSSHLTLFRMGIFGAAHGWGGEWQKGQNLSHLCYNDGTGHSYTLAKEDPKNI